MGSGSFRRLGGSYFMFKEIGALDDMRMILKCSAAGGTWNN
jgi:hypothetical protein